MSCCAAVPVHSVSVTRLEAVCGVCRYTLYVESKAYVSNLRQKMATGALVLAVRMHYYHWWSRALKPGIHFVQVHAAC